MTAVANLLLLGIGAMALYTIGKKPEPTAASAAVWPPPGSPPVPTDVTFKTPPDVVVWSLPKHVPAPVPPGTLVWVESERMMYEAIEGVSIGQPSPGALTGEMYVGWRARPDLTEVPILVGVGSKRFPDVMGTYGVGDLSRSVVLARARARARELGFS